MGRLQVCSHLQLTRSSSLCFPSILQAGAALRKLPAAFISDTAEVLQVEHTHPELPRLVFDLQVRQVKRLEMSFSLLFKGFPRVGLPVNCTGGSDLLQLSFLLPGSFVRCCCCFRAPRPSCFFGVIKGSRG